VSKSLYGAIVVLVPAAAIALGLAYGPVSTGWPWVFFGVNLVFGTMGLLVATAITYAILRRRDLIAPTIGTGIFALAFGGTFPATMYQTLMLHRDRAITIDAGALGSITRDRPVRAIVRGAWRDDLAARGTYRWTAPRVADAHGCNVYEKHYCRVPIVGEAWREGDPVLAITDCATAPGEGVRALEVTLYPADEPSNLGAMDLEDRDDKDRIDRVSCLDRPDDTHPDLSRAKFRFDPARGFLAIAPAPGHDDNPIGAAIFCGVFLLAILAYLCKRDLRHARVLTRAERDARAGA